VFELSTAAERRPNDTSHKLKSQLSLMETKPSLDYLHRFDKTYRDLVRENPKLAKIISNMKVIAI